jgi:hypothetical protein
VKLHLRPLILVAPLFIASAYSYSEVVSWTTATYSESHVVKPKRILEVCADVATKQSVAWKFTADGDVDFNVHRHAGPGGKQVIYDIEATRVRERAGTLTHAAAYEWCWMWTNVSAADVKVSVELKR